MSKIVAERYAKALIEKFDNKELESIIKNLKVIVMAFASNKFKIIIDYPIVSSKKKEELVLSLFDKEKLSKEFINFLKILSENKRFDLVPDILERLETKIRSLKNSYTGKVYSSNTISDKEILDMEKLFSEKFKSEIKLEKVQKDFNGIKVTFDELGVEINFSMDRLKHDLSNYILKAI
ncbi:ATP synthase, F1 complex, delta subunit [Campylobacter blaseri]|uniref:ATP synthase subunit delta n=1 Tax=Campylobacter blaseri TaxID=2042961 RepID=A0A2P8QZD9_9BACT|nr:F0F1 ATP synthase subunit delta [Campylobacter blaseri]PSM51601.1 ATP synthase F1 subunit delta [Campylobacter blaseri]PSM53394.1 ATP synthase F1 subunit delta [Campylobacter blaseri]QKF86690.1 ATP synthase, F1 complex, delta subunit [Campylobacter blaseri]